VTQVAVVEGPAVSPAAKGFPRPLKPNLDKTDSQPSLRDCSWLSSLPRTSVLGYSQPSLRDLIWAWLSSSVANVEACVRTE
jgi:hypothetical protein